MKTPTLIVRLLGLYLTLHALTALYVFWQVDRQAALLKQTPVATQVNNLLLINIVTLILGLALAAKAGRVAALLTFDAEPAATDDDLDDRLLK